MASRSANARARALALVAEEAAACTACDLYRRATQTVFGEGPVPAALMLIGEQPGDQEDKAGRPFVGPAGRVLDEGLAGAGLERSQVYITNAVKHFKWVERGKRRIHQRPDTGEVTACAPWLAREVEHVRPGMLVVMGATAVKAVFGGRATVGGLRGVVHPAGASRFDVPAVVTVHPAAIVRLRDREERRAALAALVDDLRLAAGSDGQRRGSRRS